MKYLNVQKETDVCYERRKAVYEDVEKFKENYEKYVK